MSAIRPPKPLCVCCGDLWRHAHNSSGVVKRKMGWEGPSDQLPPFAMSRLLLILISLAWPQSTETYWIHSNEEDFLPEHIWVWEMGTERRLQPCNKLLPGGPKGRFDPFSWLYIDQASSGAFRSSTHTHAVGNLCSESNHCGKWN